MSEIVPLGPRRFPLTGLSADDFEALCFRLARLEVAEVARTRAPDGGADALLAGPNGGYLRASQAKNHRSKIDWRKCRSSFDRAVENYGIAHFTFCFSVDLSVADQKELEKLRRLHAEVKVDHWSASEIAARLVETEEGRRVASFFFDDPAGSAELIARAVRAGGELRTVEQAVERVRAIGEHLEQDAYFIYPIAHYPQGDGPPGAPGTIFSAEYPEGGRVVRIDAVPRDGEAVERFPARLQFSLADAEAERFEKASLRGEVFRVERGVEFTVQSLPPIFADQVGRTFEGELWVDFTPDPWIAEFRAITATGEESLRLTMEPSVAPPEWERAYKGKFGGLTVSVFARLGEGQEGLAARWTHRSDGSPAREQLDALRFLAALHEEGEFIIRECEGGQRLLYGPNVSTAIPPRLPALVAFLTDIVSIEDWIGVDLEVPNAVSVDEVSEIAQIAHASRAGKAQFSGSFGIVGDPEVIPRIETADDMEIGEDWVVEVLGQELALGRRTVSFRPLSVRRGELVEPGRQEIEIEPGPLSDEEALWWALARPA